MNAPVKGYRVTTPYGKRNARLWRWLGYHTGDDYACPVGTIVRATRAGRVSRVSSDKSFGLYVVVNHGSGVTSWYCHLSRRSVKVGQRVVAGSVVGYSGRSGNVTGPHLHYEERKHGFPRRPVFNKTAPPVASFKPAPFPKGIAPNRRRPSAMKLQLALQRAGYMSKSVKRDPNYGPRTQAAVAKFHDSPAGRKFKSRRLRLLGRKDVRIGPKGWKHLMTKTRTS